MNTKEMIMSGVLTGISGILARLGMKSSGPGLSFLSGFLFNPMLLLSGAFGIAGFVYLQRSLFRYEISYAGPIISSIAIVTPLILAATFLGESISGLRWIGAGLIILGVAGMANTSKDLNSGFSWERLKRFLGV
jgi:multidrug transporter EmrE-like cation transporter